MLRIRLATLKRGLLLFWAVWFSFVFATNVLDGLKETGVLPQTWRYTSGNFRFVVSVVSVQHAPVWVAAVLFFGVIVREGACVVLFWNAVRRFGRGGTGRTVAVTAFAVSIALFATFSVAVEAFIAFEKMSEGVFQTLLALNLLSLLAVCLLPDD